MKWLHALSMCAADNVSEAELTVKPKGCTKSPYAVDDVAKPTKRSRATYEDTGAVAGALFLDFPAWHLLRSTQSPPCGTLLLPTASRENSQQELRNLDRNFSIATLLRAQGCLRVNSQIIACIWQSHSISELHQERTHTFCDDATGAKAVSDRNPIGWLRSLGQFLARAYHVHFLHLVVHVRSTLRAQTQETAACHHTTSCCCCWLVLDLHTRPVRRRNGAGSVFRIQRCAMRNNL